MRVESPQSKKRPLFQCCSSSPEETMEAGKKLAQMLHPGDLVTFFGELGAGKTTFIKGLVSAIAQLPIEEVTSPTFTYLHTYPGDNPIHHFDLYRLTGPEPFLQMGFFEYLQGPNICLIEWSEKISSLIPSNSMEVQISYLGETKREIAVFKGNP